MASNLRRMVVLGPSGTINPGGSHDYRSASNRLFFSDTRTRWVRFWADWPSLEPANGQLDTARLAALDAQIARADRTREARRAQGDPHAVPLPHVGERDRRADARAARRD